jgi:hypothetical protein
MIGEINKAEDAMWERNGLLSLTVVALCEPFLDSMLLQFVLEFSD